MFSGNSNGMRAIAISSAESVDATYVIKQGISANPWTNIPTRVRYISHAFYSKGTKVKLYAYQNSGSDLVVESTGLVSIRIK